MKLGQIFIALSIPLLLGSCFGNTGEDQQKQQNTSSQSSQDTTINGTPISDGSGSEVGANGVTQTASGVFDNPKYLDKASSDVINQIQTLEQLDLVMSGASKLPFSKHPKFIELQKKKLLLGLLVGKTPQEQRAELERKMDDIRTGKEIWPESLKKVDSEYMEALKNSKGNISNATFKKVADKRNKAYVQFLESDEYSKYQDSKQEELNALYKQVQDIFSPEIKKLQDEVSVLSKEVYSAK